MIITLFDRAEQSNPDTADCVDLSGSRFLDLLGDSEKTPSQECVTEKDKLNGAGFILAEYRKGSRTKGLKNLDPKSHTDVFCYDIDSMSVEEITEVLPLWQACSAVMYSTYKHRPNTPRYRLLVELASPVPNKNKEPYTGLYKAVAHKLKIKMDPKTLDRARLFFGPQHQKNIEPERVRFRGKPVATEGLDAFSSDETTKVTKDELNIPGDRPGRQELKKFVNKLRKSKSRQRKRLAPAVEAFLRGEPFAKRGSRHDTAALLAFELVREYPALDAVWTLETYFSTFWKEMWDDDPKAGLTDWINAVESAQHKLTQSAEEKERASAAQQRLGRSAEPPIPEIQTLVEQMAGKLVMSYRGGYFIYSPKCRAYKGPFKPSEVAIGVRDLLGGVEGISEVEITRAGVSLKSAIQLNHEYGTTADNVLWFARRPPQAWDEESQGVCLQAYKWMHWETVYHQIADDLLRAIAGDHYPLLEKYLFAFRNLDQPLPALTFVGPKGTWKSRICEILSMFWCSKHGPTAGKAKKIMARFNGHLTKNPVIWSDEELAISEYGKPQPEAYRESITSRTQTVEFKGLDGLTVLNSAVRHVIAVNDDSKVFSSEVDADCVHATMERFLLLYTETDAINAVEDKWRNTLEMDRLRRGDSLLEHIRWIEQNTQHVSECRLFLQPHTEAQILLRARFSDDTLYYLWKIAIGALEKEPKFAKTKNMDRLPLFMLDGIIYLNPTRLHDMWRDSKEIAGSGLRKPSTQKIGQLLTKAGFKKYKTERASKNRHGGWEVNTETLQDFLKASDFILWEDLIDLFHAIGREKDQ